MKTISFQITRPTDASELLCPDGEVSSFYNIPYLLPENAVNPDETGDSDGDSGNNSNTTSGSSNDPAGYSLVLKAATSAVFPLSLPSGSRPLCYHSPISNSTLKLLILQKNNALGVINAKIRDENGNSIASGGNSQSAGSLQNIAFWPAALGRLKQALPYGNVVTLIAENGIAYLLYNPVGDSYSFEQSLPKAPVPELTMSVATLPGYITVAGRQPEASISLALPNAGEIGENDIRNWINGVQGSLPEACETAIRKAFEEVRKGFVEAVKANGLFLQPVKVVAALGGTLPSEARLTSEKVQEITLSIEDYGWHAGRLTLKLSISAIPMRLSVKVSDDGALRRWSSIFPTIDIYVAKIADDVEGGTETAQKFLQELTDCNEYTHIGEISAAADAGTLIVKNSDEIGKSGDSSDVFIPDYRDFSDWRPRGGALTDEGVILFGGRGRICDEKGGFSEVSLENAFVATATTSAGDVLPVFRNLQRVADGRIVGVAQSSRSRSATSKRHTLLIFSENGIRVCSGTGGSTTADSSWIQSQLLSPIACQSPELTGNDSEDADFIGAFAGRMPIALTEKGVCFATRRGVQFIGYGSSAPEMYAEISRPLVAIRYSHRLDTLLIYCIGKVYSYDISAKTLDEIEDFGDFASAQRGADAGNFVEWSGELEGIIDSGEMAAVRLVRRYAAAGEIGGSEEEKEVQKVAEVRKVAEISEAGEVASEGGAYFVTRALKLGDIFGRKRVRRIALTTAGARVCLEGSDDLGVSAVWRPVAEGVAPLSSLRVAAWRYYRLRVEFAAGVPVVPVVVEIRVDFLT